MVRLTHYLLFFLKTSEKDVPLPLTLTVSLPRHVYLKVQIRDATSPHDLAVICDDRSLQTDLSARIPGMYEEAQEQGKLVHSCGIDGRRVDNFFQTFLFLLSSLLFRAISSRK
jgi:hypothetical protein